MATAVFVVGTTRSGTSWVYDLVASHPDLSFGYESKLPVEGIGIYRRWAGRLVDEAGAAGLLQALRHGIDDPANESWTERVFDDPDLPTRVLAAHRADPRWGAVCEQVFLAQEHTTHWGNKTVRMSANDLLQRHFPDSRFLVLVRDPRAVVASQSERFGHSLEYSVMYWMAHATRVLAESIRHPHHRVVDVADMARDPRPELRWLFSSAELDTSPVEGLVASYPGDAERLDRWRGTLGSDRQRRVEEYCFEPMLQLGYVPELATGPVVLPRRHRAWALARAHGLDVLSEPTAIRRKRVLPRGLEMLSAGIPRWGQRRDRTGADPPPAP